VSEPIVHWPIDQVFEAKRPSFVGETLSDRMSLL
jgi:hypothetical protein